jgi:hypothetical protein
MEWLYHEPKFECDEYNKYMLLYAPWSGHRYWGYDLISNIRPKMVVELGSFYGCSMFSFAQAVKDGGLDTELFAIDLWDACDEYTKDSYIEDVYGEFLKVKDKCYVNQKLNMLRMSFDQAVDLFENKSIDILHIDGSHLYEDVKHDFLTWLPKLKDTAIVLFHDVSDEKVNGSVMGSYLYWQELKKLYPEHMTFDFSLGLGVLFLSSEMYKQVKTTIDMLHYQKKNNSFDVSMKDEICKNYFEIRNQKEYILDLKNQISIKNIHLERYKEERERVKADYEKTIMGKDCYISKLEAEKSEHDNWWLHDREKVQHDYELTIQKKDEYIRLLEKKLNIM